MLESFVESVGSVRPVGELIVVVVVERAELVERVVEQVLVGPVAHSFELVLVVVVVVVVVKDDEVVWILGLFVVAPESLLPVPEWKLHLMSMFPVVVLHGQHSPNTVMLVGRSLMI
jgi:hypothetical protein